MFWFIDKMNSRIHLYTTPVLVEAPSRREAIKKYAEEIGVLTADLEYCNFILPAVKSIGQYHGFKSKGHGYNLSDIFDFMSRAKINIRVNAEEPEVIRFKEND